MFAPWRSQKSVRKHKDPITGYLFITFACKQTIMKLDIHKFNLTQFKCRIQNIINLLVNRKKLNVFFLLLSF